MKRRRWKAGHGHGFDGLRVLSLESRRGAEMGRLIETYGGEAVVAPSMREVPLESNLGRWSSFGAGGGAIRRRRFF